jgi:hypothetical protein
MSVPCLFLTELVGTLGVEVQRCRHPVDKLHCRSFGDVPNMSDSAGCRRHACKGVTACEPQVRMLHPSSEYLHDLYAGSQSEEMEGYAEGKVTNVPVCREMPMYARVE